jgi:uncharacterized caspase-like protein
MRIFTFVAFTLLATVSLSTARAEPTEKRVALVIGNAAYPSAALPTTANDAGLIAQTLQAAGFDVVGARDLDQDTLRRTFRDFLDKVTASGPDTVAFVYLSGYGVQLEGDNYIVPIDAKLARDTDVPLEALRLSDYTRPLAAMKIKAGIVVLDAARANAFAQSGQPLANGLALSEPEPHMLMAFNAAPGTVAPAENGPYGAYAQALAEMIRTGGLPLNDVFERTRLRVNEMTKGGEVPWHASKIDAPIMFFDRAADAPAPAQSEQGIAMRSRPIRDIGAQDGYVAALERDTLQGYLDFLAAYPNDPMAKRVRAIVAARREALTWRRTRSVDTPPAYWSYLRRYPYGPHVADARRRLAFLAAAFDPPPSFAVIDYDLPPPPVEEEVYFRRPVLVFDDPDYGFVPPPPPPVFFLPPLPPDFVVLPPPPPVYAAYILPIPDYVPLPVYYRPPVYVAPPPPNLIYNNIHNTVIVNNTTNMVTITRPGGAAQTVTPAQAVASPPPAGAPTSPPVAAVPPQVQSPTPAVNAAALLAPRLPTPVVSRVNANPSLLTSPPGKPAGVPGAPVAAPQAGGPRPADRPAAAQLPGAPGAQPLPSGARPTAPGGAAPSPAAGAARVAPSVGAPSSAAVNGRPVAPTQAQQTPASPPAARPAPGATPPKPAAAPAARVAPITAPRETRSRVAPPVSPPQRAAPARPVQQAAPMMRPARPVPPPVVRQAPPPQMARPAPPPMARPAPPPMARPAPPPVARPSPPPRPAAPPPRPAPAAAKHCAPGQTCR